MAVIMQKGTTHTATIPVTVLPAGVGCTIRLGLTKDGGANMAASSGAIGFTSTGVQQSVALSITMPNEWGEYEVYIDVMYENLVIGAYIATDHVIIPYVEVGPPQW